MNEYYNNVLENGACVARCEGNWDMWLYNGVLYSIAKKDSGAGHSVWCSVLGLKKHLSYLAFIHGSKTLIPDDWQVVNPKFFESLGIM